MKNDFMEAAYNSKQRKQYTKRLIIFIIILSILGLFFLLPLGVDVNGYYHQLKEMTFASINFEEHTISCQSFQNNFETTINTKQDQLTVSTFYRKEFVPISYTVTLSKDFTILREGPQNLTVWYWIGVFISCFLVSVTFGSILAFFFVFSSECLSEPFCKKKPNEV